MRGAGSRVPITEVDLICAVVPRFEGSHVVVHEPVVRDFIMESSLAESRVYIVYGCRLSLPDSFMGVAGDMFGGKRVLACGYGEVGKDGVFAMRGAGDCRLVTGADPICALLACLEGSHVVRLELVVRGIGMVCLMGPGPRVGRSRRSWSGGSPSSSSPCRS
eukprot:6531120-Lingulodinium_polyedra.AAC.1